MTAEMCDLLTSVVAMERIKARVGGHKLTQGGFHEGNSGTGCPEEVLESGWCCLNKGLVQNGFQRSLPTSATVIVISSVLLATRCTLMLPCSLLVVKPLLLV